MRHKYISVLGFGSVLLALSSIISRILGVFRDHVFAQVFGSGMDAYFLAFRIPDLIYNLLVFGGISAAFVPIYTRLLKKNDDAASEFGSEIFNAIFLLLTFVIVIFYFLVPFLMPLIAPGLSKEVLAESVALTRIMLLSPIFLGLSSVLQGIHNSKKVFYGIAAAPIVYNIAIIIAAKFYGGAYGLTAVAWGVSSGSALHLLLQIPFLYKLGFRYVPRIKIDSAELKNFLKLSIPRIFGLSVAQLGIFVDTTIASLLVAGSLSIYNFSINLQSLPYAVVAVSFTVAIFSTLSELSNDPPRFAAMLRKSTSTILFWVLPAVTGIFLLREELVGFVLGGGAFGESASSLTAFTLGIFIWASVPQSLVPLFARAFYALENTKIPVLSAFVSVLANIAIALTLTQFYNLPVWALAISAICSNSINALILLKSLAIRFKVSIFDLFDLRKILHILGATFVMAAAVYATLDYVRDAGYLVALFSSTFAGMLIYFVCGFLLKTMSRTLEVQKNLKG